LLRCSAIARSTCLSVGGGSLDKNFRHFAASEASKLLRKDMRLRLTIKRVLALAATFAFTAAIYGCGQPGPSSDSTAQLRRGLSGEPSSLDPASAGDNFSAQVIQDVFEGLTAESPDGTVVPAVASSWTVDPDGLRYTFHLRSTARWSNGEPVRARDFVSAWRRVLDPKQGSPVADDLRMIHGAADILAGKSPSSSLGVSAPSSDTLIVSLDQPAPYLPEVMSHSASFPIYSEQTARSHKAADWVSNGPYVLVNWQNGGSIDLKKNPNYWDNKNVHIPIIHYQFSSDEASQYAQYRAGQLDLTDTVPATAIPSLREAHSTELVIAPFLATAYYGFNLASGSIGKNVKLRQALSMAIDRHRLVDSLGFGQPPAYGFIPPGTANYQRQSVPWKDLANEARIGQAQSLYAEAGYSKVSPLRLKVLYNTNVVIKRTAIMIAAMWKETLGVDTELVGQEYQAFLVTRHDKSQWDVARLAWVADYNDASNFLATFRSNSSNNDESYANASFDGLLDLASSTPDKGVRQAVLENAERLLLAEYPIAPLYHYVSKRLVKPYVSGVEPTPTDRVPSKAISMRPH
jgi:oligopeptide transport system substrate-binding protein